MFIKNILLLYQLENYDPKRFLSSIYRNPSLIFSKKRQELDYTKKMILLIILWILLTVIAIFSGVAFFQKPLFSIISSVSVIVFSPVLLVISNLLIFPVDLYLKKRIIAKAKQKLSRYGNILVI